MLLSLVTKAKGCSVAPQRARGAMQPRRTYYRAHRPYRGRLMYESLVEKSIGNPFGSVSISAESLGLEFMRNTIPDPPMPYHKSIRLNEPFVQTRGSRRASHCLSMHINSRHTDNALDVPLLQRLRDLIFKYAGNKTTLAIIWKAFNDNLCTGVDLYSIYEMLHKHKTTKPIRDYYRQVYETSYYLATADKVFLPLLQGDVSGIGAAIALNAPYPIATENTRVSLPGCRFGSLGAEGGSLFKFSRLPGRLGEYFMVTGRVLHSSDVVHVGLAPYLMPSDRVDLLEERLSEAALPDMPHLLNTMDPMMDRPQPSTIFKYFDAINRIFDKDSIIEIIQALKEETEHVEWAKNTLEAMEKGSPLAMAITLKAVRCGRYLPLLGCYNLEHAAMCRLIQHPEYSEGVSAFVEGRRPNWTYQRHEDVPEDEVNSFIAPLPIRKTLRLEKVDPLSIRLHPEIEVGRYREKIRLPIHDLGNPGFDSASAEMDEVLTWVHSELLKPAGQYAYHRMLDAEDSFYDAVQALGSDGEDLDVTHSTE